MFWFEDDKDASALKAVRNAVRYYNSKYGHVPKLVELPPEWEQDASDIEAHLDDLKVSVSKMIQPRIVAITHET